MVFPFFSNTVDKTSEKQKVAAVITAIADLRKNAVSHMAVGEIEVQGRDLVFYLDNRETHRISLPAPPAMSRGIYFNRYGITSGGDIYITFKKRYKITIKEVTGKISVSLRA